VTFRIVQGLGGAMMTPVGRLVLLRTAPRHELVRAMAYLTIPALMGPMIGPPIGGFIATYFHWRYIFWINVPIGALGVMLVTRFIPDMREEWTPPLDIAGAILSGVGLSCLVFGFTIAGRGFAPAPVVVLIVALGAGALFAYVRHARRKPYPIVDLDLLQIPTFRAAVFGGFLFRIGLGATPFLLPLLLQAGFGLSAYEAGLLTFVSAAGAMAMKTTAQPILRIFSFRRVLIVNALISAGFLAFNASFSATTPHLVIMGVLLVGGFFRSLEFTALNAIAYADVDQDAMSRATSFASVAQQLSLSTGVAIGAAALEATRALRGGGALQAADFAPAFIVVALISMFSVLSFLPLARNAGDDLTGRRKRV
jgi:MFS family permease